MAELRPSKCTDIRKAREMIKGLGPKEVRWEIIPPKVDSFTKKAFFFSYETK